MSTIEQYRATREMLRNRMESAYAAWQRALTKLDRAEEDGNDDPDWIVDMEDHADQLRVDYYLAADRYNEVPIPISPEFLASNATDLSFALRNALLSAAPYATTHGEAVSNGFMQLHLSTEVLASAFRGGEDVWLPYNPREVYPHADGHSPDDRLLIYVTSGDGVTAERIAAYYARRGERTVSPCWEGAHMNPQNRERYTPWDPHHKQA